MVLKVRRAALPAPPPTWSQRKGREGQEGLKGVAKQPPVTYSPADETQWLSRWPKSKRAPPPRETSSKTTTPSSDSTADGVKHEGQRRLHVLMLTGDVQVSKQQIKQAVTKLQAPDWPRSMPWLALMEWREVRPIDPRLWCLRCYHQNWDCLAWFCHRQTKKKEVPEDSLLLPCNNLPRKDKKKNRSSD